MQNFNRAVRELSTKVGEPIGGFFDFQGFRTILKDKLFDSGTSGKCGIPYMLDRCRYAY